MKEDFQKLMELVKTDKSIQKKLEEVCSAYEGEQTEQAVFENILRPIAEEAGLSVTFDDLTESVQELNLDEMAQVSGGEMGAGIGYVGCDGLGFGVAGIGSTNPDPSASHCFGGCIIIGYGQGTSGCLFAGAQHDFSKK